MSQLTKRPANSISDCKLCISHFYNSKYCWWHISKDKTFAIMLSETSGLKNKLTILTSGKITRVHGIHIEIQKVRRQMPDDRGSIHAVISSPPRPDWLWGPPSLPSSGYRVKISLCLTKYHAMKLYVFINEAPHYEDV